MSLSGIVGGDEIFSGLVRNKPGREAEDNAGWIACR